MRFFVLASGSAGNSTYLDFGGCGVLIDCGISKRQLTAKLNDHGHDFNEIQYVFLTHDHTDHNKNIHLFDPAMVYTGEGCLPGALPEHILKPYDILTFPNFTVIPLPTSHDATSPFGFVFMCGKQKLVYVTDTGYVSSKNASYMVNADYYIIESNHDVGMLMGTNRPMYLKNRILSDYGHLSNDDSANLMCRLVGSNTKEIVLAHLSREANTPELALKTYQDILASHHLDGLNFRLRAASQTDVLEGGNDED